MFIILNGKQDWRWRLSKCSRHGNCWWKVFCYSFWKSFPHFLPDIWSPVTGPVITIRPAILLLLTLIIRSSFSKPMFHVHCTMSKEGGIIHGSEEVTGSKLKNNHNNWIEWSECWMEGTLNPQTFLFLFSWILSLLFSTPSPLLLKDS